MIIDLERILFVLSTIVGVAFWMIGLYISIIIKWNWEKHTRGSDKCIERIVNNFKWDSKSSNINDKIGTDEKVPLVYFLMIGCMTIGSVLILNSLFSVNDILILVPIINKIFLFLLFTGIVLVLVYLFEFVKFLSNIDDGNQKVCKDTIELKLNIDDLSKNLNISLGIIAGIILVLFILIVGPTVMAQTSRKK
jgi:hypothetical protein